jgi:hypothetical protein
VQTTMSSESKWARRKFDFNFPLELYPEILERLRGTPPAWRLDCARFRTQSCFRRSVTTGQSRSMPAICWILSHWPWAGSTILSLVRLYCDRPTWRTRTLTRLVTTRNSSPTPNHEYTEPEYTRP